MQVGNKNIYKQVKINFTESDFNKINELAKDKTKAEFIRTIIKKYLNKKNIELDTNIQISKKSTVRKNENPTDLKILYLISTIANNINQVAKIANTRNLKNNKNIFDIITVQLLEKINKDFDECKKILLSDKDDSQF